MGWLTGLFTPKAATDVVEGAINGIDAIFYTDEEKAEAVQKIQDTWVDMVKATAQENTIKSRTRRWLAWMIMGNFLLLLDSAVILYLLKNVEGAKFILSIAGQLSTMAAGVAFFYFGYYAVANVISKKKGE